MKSFLSQRDKNMRPSDKSFHVDSINLLLPVLLLVSTKSQSTETGYTSGALRSRYLSTLG